MTIMSVRPMNPSITGVSNSDSVSGREINDGRNDHTGGHGGVVEDEDGGEGEVANDRRPRLEIFLFLLTM